MIYIPLLLSRYGERMITPKAAIDWSEPNGFRAQVALSVAGETLTATLSGELDRLNTEDVMPIVGDAVAAGTSCLVIDLGGLTFIDSSGIHALLKLHRTLGTEGIDVRLAVPDDAPVRRTLEVANVVHLIDAAGPSARRTPERSPADSLATRA
jgi:anti-sigma B factor antagonist